MKRSLPILLLVAATALWFVLKDDKAEPQQQTENETPTSETDKSNATPEQTKSTPPPEDFLYLTQGLHKYTEKAEQVRRINGSQLTAPEVDAFYALLDHQPTAHHESWWVILNEVMEQIEKQGIAPERITTTFLGILQNKELPEIPRDYAIQHLAFWLTPSLEGLDKPYELDPKKAKTAILAITKVLQEPELSHSSIPGTALAALHYIQNGQVLPEVMDQAIESLHPWLDAVITKRLSTSSSTQAEAIQAAADFGLVEFTPKLRKFAYANKGEASPDLILRSIAALGQIGDTTDLPKLQQLAQSNSPHRYAAQSALQNLQSL